MVKHAPPLQIRLTEPVIFLHGPSTGMDFRGRPQAVNVDGPPAMLRGLLTLRLSKATRIRSINIALEGKARTEWPEGIGAKRTETSEEHILISESTTFFAAHRESSRSQSNRRATSVGPGLSLSQWDLEDEDIDDEFDLVDVPGENEDPGGSMRGRERTRGDIIRSASAMPDSSTYERARRSSFGRPARDILGVADLSLRERGPSPAYTPNPEPSISQVASSTHDYSSPLRNSISGPSRYQPLSPIASAAVSRDTSDRGSSAGTEPRSSRPPAPDLSRVYPNHAEDEEARSLTPVGGSIDESALDEEEIDPLAQPIRPILGGGTNHRESNGVRFDETVRGGNSPEPVQENTESVTETPEPTAGPSAPEEKKDPNFAHTEDVSDRPESPVVSMTERLPQIVESPTQTMGEFVPEQTQRAASLRTITSHLSTSSTSLSISSNDHSTEIHHPASLAVQPISSVNTPAISPAGTPNPSAPPSVRSQRSTEALPLSDTANSAPSSTREIGESTSSPPTAASSGSSRRSSLLARDSVLPMTQSPLSSSADLTEVRVGRKSRLGSASTIVQQNQPARSASSLGNGLPPVTASGRRSASGSMSLSARPSLDHLRNTSNGSHEESDGRGRKHGKFSLSAALRGLSQDVKDRVHHKRQESKSRSRAESTLGSTRSRTPSIAEGTHPYPSSSAMSRQGSGTAFATSGNIARTGRAESISQPGEFHPPFGRGGAGRRSRSREPRSGSPGAKLGERSESRGRGRKKGMKALTGALGLGHDEEEEGEDLHNWKEFRKGVYNYPISFPIPVDAPPTIHAEFGTVVYRLKATVVRVGALTPNLVEDVEVVMIASPQEDDTEESENVIVERQWEEQMRYQIVLGGKAFPIGGTIPISINLMPLMKCKIHRLTVALEEKIDYYAQERKVARHETPRKFIMLAIKQPEKKERIEPLLPIISDSPTAAQDSPLAALAIQAAMNAPLGEFDVEGLRPTDDAFATLLDPMGPWALAKDLIIPDCHSRIKFTTKHEKTNLTIAHVIKITIRVERGDDVAVDARGKRKLFDIIIETPVKLLNCRVSSKWNSLPTYAAVNPGATGQTSGCSIHGNTGPPIASTSRPPIVSTLYESFTPPTRNAGLPPFTSSRENSYSRERTPHDTSEPHRRVTELPAQPTAGGTSAEHEDTLLERNIVYDRLMSGQETETGEIPPSYGEAVASSVRSQSRSQSRARMRSRLGSEVIGPGGVDLADTARGSSAGRAR